jgi:hypothetical protein
MSRRSTGTAGFLDVQMDRGITWDQLLALVEAEAERSGRGKSYCTMGRLKAHARWRAEHDKWHVIEMNDERVRIVRPVIA